MDKAFFSKNNPKKNPRLVSIRDMVVFCFAFLAPLSPTFFYARAAGASGGSLAFGYLIAAILVLLTILSFRKFIDQVPGEPSSLAYVAKAIHPLAGFANGWSFLLLYLAAPAAAFIFSANLMKSVAPGIPVIVWIVLLALIALGVNFIGTRGVNTGNLLLFAISFAFAAVFILVCFMAASKGLGIGKLFSSKPFVGVDAGFGGHFSAVALAIGSLLGIEAVMTVSAGTDESRKKLKIALMIAAIVISIFFFLQVYAAQLVWPDIETLTDDTAMLSVARRAGGSPMVLLLLFSILTSATAVGVSGQLAAARMLETFGDTDALPQSIFATQQRRSGAPIINHVIVFAITVITGITVSSVTTLLELVRFGGLLGFVLMNFATIRYFWLKKKNQEKDLLLGLIFPAIGLLTSLGFIVTIKPIVLIIGFVWVVIGAVTQIASIQEALSERVSKPSPARKKGKHVPFMAKSQNDLDDVLFLDENDREDSEEEEIVAQKGPRAARQKPGKESREDAIARKLSAAFDGIPDEPSGGDIFDLPSSESDGEDYKEMQEMFSFLEEDTTSEDPFEFEASHRYQANEFFGEEEREPEEEEPLYDEPAYDEPAYEKPAYDEPSYRDQEYIEKKYLKKEAPRPVQREAYSESIDEQLARAQSVQVDNTDILNQIQKIVSEGARPSDAAASKPKTRESSGESMMFRKSAAASVQPKPARGDAEPEMHWSSVSATPKDEATMWRNPHAPRKNEEIVWDTPVESPEPPKATQKKEEFHWE
ncbi:MAG: APC family permease [Clostridiales Family XIII bacterium]|jgi:amino acid transporter|nr:APC family permease [Clostridiales Family XIII bacterium]